MLCLGSMSWYYAFIARYGLGPANNWSTKDMTQSEWLKIKFDEFVPSEMAFITLLSRKYPDILCKRGILKRTLCWNDDEFPFVFMRKRKQIESLNAKEKVRTKIKNVATTRDPTKRFCTLSPFVNADAFTTIPERFAICLVILPGSMSKAEAARYKRLYPQLRAACNDKAWMTQEVWEFWSFEKMDIIQRVRNYLKQKRDFPHLNWMDNQPQHVSAESVQSIDSELENNNFYYRFFPKNSTMHVQMVDQHIGRSIQQKLQRSVYDVLSKQNRKRLMGQRVEKICLPEMRAMTMKFVNEAFAEVIHNEKDMIYKAFNEYGLNTFSNRVWGGYDGMKGKPWVFEVCEQDICDETMRESGNGKEEACDSDDDSKSDEEPIAVDYEFEEKLAELMHQECHGEDYVVDISEDEPQDKGKNKESDPNPRPKKKAKTSEWEWFMSPKSK